MKQKYKAYIGKQKKELNQAKDKINSMEQLSKEYESKSIMANEYAAETNEHFEKLKKDFEQAQIERDGLQKRCQILGNENEVIKSEKIEIEQQLASMEELHTQNMANYKDKAKAVITKHRNAADQKCKTMQMEKDTLTQQMQALTEDIAQHEQTKNAFEESIASLNGKLRENQNEIGKLKQVNDGLKESEQTLRKREDTLAQISAALGQCSFFKSDDSNNATISIISTSIPQSLTRTGRKRKLDIPAMGNLSTPRPPKKQMTEGPQLSISEYKECIEEKQNLSEKDLFEQTDIEPAQREKLIQQIIQNKNKQIKKAEDDAKNMQQNNIRTLTTLFSVYYASGIKYYFHENLVVIHCDHCMDFPSHEQGITMKASDLKGNGIVVEANIHSNTAKFLLLKKEMKRHVRNHDHILNQMEGKDRMNQEAFTVTLNQHKLAAKLVITGLGNNQWPEEVTRHILMGIAMGGRNHSVANVPLINGGEG